MIAPSPLLNKRILNPRGKGQAKPFSDLVKQNGGIPVEVPLIAFRAVNRNVEIDGILTNLDTYDWVFLTSNVAVDTFFSLLKENEKSKLPKVAVIGIRTKQLLLNRGIPVEFTPSEYVAEGFVKEFLPLVKQGMKVFLPKGNLARDYIAEALRKHGAIVDEAIIYETYAPEDAKGKLAQILKNAELDILTFTSPSTVDHFIEVVEEYNLYDKINKLFVAVIGPVAKKRALEVGLPVHVMPKDYTVKDMVQAIIDNLNQEALDK